MFELDFTHDPQRTSWVDSANEHLDFPIQNLPFGVYQSKGGSGRIGIAIGDQILDAQSVVAAGLISDSETGKALGESNLNRVMSLTKSQRINLRHELSNLLASDSAVDLSLIHI